MYSKGVPEIGAETDIETTMQNVDTSSQTPVIPCHNEISDEMCSNAIESADIEALTVLDLVDLAAEFEQINQLSVLSCFDQSLPVETVDDKIQPCESVPANRKCDSPFMQLNDETVVAMDTETCNVWSPSSGYGSTSPSAKSLFEDDVCESFFMANADEYSWHDSFTLFPALGSYN